MNDADIDLINKTFYPGWLMVSQLRSGQEVKDGEALYRRACRWVNAARESLNKAGFSTTSCEHMLYAYCALMDESVLNRDKQDDGYCAITKCFRISHCISAKCRCVWCS